MAFRTKRLIVRIYLARQYAPAFRNLPRQHSTRQNPRLRLRPQRFQRGLRAVGSRKTLVIIGLARAVRPPGTAVTCTKPLQTLVWHGRYGRYGQKAPPAGGSRQG